MHGARPNQKCYPAPAYNRAQGNPQQESLQSPRAGEEDHEGFVHPPSEEVVPVKLHPTKPSTTALGGPKGCPASPAVVTGSDLCAAPTTPD